MRIRIWSNIRHAVSKSGHFTHDMTFFHHDVRGKRFNTHGELHCMEMIISKDLAARPGGVAPGQGENPVFRITKKYVPLNR